MFTIEPAPPARRIRSSSIRNEWKVPSRFDRQDAAPHLRVVVGHGLVGHADAGRVDGQVEPSERRLDVRPECVDLCRVADVDLRRDDSARRAGQLTREPFGRVEGQVGDDDVCPGRGERPNTGGADPRGSPGDQRDRATEVVGRRARARVRHDGVPPSRGASLIPPRSGNP